MYCHTIAPHKSTLFIVHPTYATRDTEDLYSMTQPRSQSTILHNYHQPMLVVMPTPRTLFVYICLYLFILSSINGRVAQ